MTIGEQAIDHVWKVLARVMLRRSGRYANKRPDALEEDQLARILRNGALAIRHQAVMSPTWADDPHHHNAVAVLRCFWSRAALVEGQTDGIEVRAPYER